MQELMHPNDKNAIQVVRGLPNEKEPDYPECASTVIGSIGGL